MKFFAYKEDTVYFITDDGSEYLVGFIEETNIGIQRAYQLFIIKKENGIHIGTDVKIGRTVSSIVHSFFVTFQLYPKSAMQSQWQSQLQ